MTWPPVRKIRPAKPKAERKRRAHPEQDVQITAVELLRIITIAPARFWHVPNGEKRDKATAARLKRMGVEPGVLDLHFMWPGGFGLIEMKAGKGSLSADQVLFREHAIACGHHFAECRTVGEVIAALTAWGFPMRGTS